MEREKFAWAPVKVTSGRWAWLTTYYQHQSLYDETTGRPPLNSLHFTWTETASERSWRVLKETAVHNRNVWNDVQLTKEDKL
jgi:hypothetical protein